MEYSYVIVGLLMLAVVVVLAVGVIFMGSGGKANARFGNKLMIVRVALQALVIVIAGAIMFGIV